MRQGRRQDAASRATANNDPAPMDDLAPCQIAERLENLASHHAELVRAEAALAVRWRALEAQRRATEAARLRYLAARSDWENDLHLAAATGSGSTATFVETDVRQLASEIRSAFRFG
jgi:hypothetical protein